MILFDPQKTFGYHAYCFEKQVPSWLLSSIIHVLIVMGGGLGTLSLLIWFGIELGILGHFITQWVGLFITIAILVFLLINWRVFLEWLKAPHPKKSLQDAIQGDVVYNFFKMTAHIAKAKENAEKNLQNANIQICKLVYKKDKFKY